MWQARSSKVSILICLGVATMRAYLFSSFSAWQWYFFKKVRLFCARNVLLQMNCVVICFDRRVDVLLTKEFSNAHYMGYKIYFAITQEVHKSGYPTYPVNAPGSVCQSPWIMRSAKFMMLRNVDRSTHLKALNLWKVRSGCRYTAALAHTRKVRPNFSLINLRLLISVIVREQGFPPIYWLHNSNVSTRTVRIYINIYIYI